MVEATRARGRGDTSAPRPARWGRGAPERAFRLALAAALLLHLPLFPTSIGQWVRLLLSHGPSDYDDADAGAIIPIDLDLAGGEPAPASTASELTGAAPAEQKAQAESAGPSDAGADASPTAALDASADASPDASLPRHRPEPPDGGPPDSGPPPADAGAPPLRDPVAAAGNAGKISAKDANVQVLIASKVLRKHPLGTALGRLLVQLPSWHQFFADSPLDPIRDLDHVLITSPRFIGDTSEMVAVMDFNVPEPKLKAALDLVVQRTGGEWLTDTPFPTAQARVAQGVRLFALIPGKKLLVVLPLDAKNQLEGLKQSKGFKSSPVGVVVSLVSPSRPFASVLPLPSTLKWLRIAITPTPDGGADLALETGDKSPEDAQKHAPEITAALDRVRVVDMVVTKLDVLDHTEFVAEKDLIKARVHVSDRQLKLILGSVEQQIRDNGHGAGGILPPIPVHGGSAPSGR